MKLISLTVGGTQVQPPFGVPTGGLEPGGTGQKLAQLGINGLFVVGICFVVIFIILSGVQWITSGGDEKKVEKARARLIYSIVGLVVIIGAFSIVNIVLSLFGLPPI